MAEKVVEHKFLGMTLALLAVVFQLGMFVCLKHLYYSTTITPFEAQYVRGISDLGLAFIIAKSLDVDMISVRKDLRSIIFI